MQAAPIVVPLRPRQPRRQEVVARLATAMPRGPGDQDWAGRLREAADDLGPVFASFAAYLGTRVDLLPIADCRALARTTHTADIWPLSRVMRAIAAEIEDGTALVGLRPDPLSTTPVSQTHASRLRTGECVVVEVLTVDVAAADGAFELLPLLQRPCAGRIAAHAFTAAVADFIVRFREQCDGRRRWRMAAAAMVAAPHTAAGWWGMPRLELCGERVFVHQVTDLPSSCARRGDGGRNRGELAARGYGGAGLSDCWGRCAAWRVRPLACAPAGRIRAPPARLPARGRRRFAGSRVGLAGG